MTHGQIEFLKYFFLQGNEVSELGFLKESLIGGFNSWIHFRVSFEIIL